MSSAREASHTAKCPLRATQREGRGREGGEEREEEGREGEEGALQARRHSAHCPRRTARAIPAERARGPPREREGRRENSIAKAGSSSRALAFIYEKVNETKLKTRSRPRWRPDLGRDGHAIMLVMY